MLLLSAVGKRRKVEIVNNCFIGTNSIILKGTIVGDNVIIGAGSVLAGGAFPPDSVLRKSGKGYLLVLIYCRLPKQCNALQIVGIKTALNENRFKGMCL